jgi:hypothetical protein
MLSVQFLLNSKLKSYWTSKIEQPLIFFLQDFYLLIALCHGSKPVLSHLRIGRHLDVC